MPQKRKKSKNHSNVVSSILSFGGKNIPKRNIILFILIFGAIGSYFVWRSLAVSSTLLTAAHLDVNSSSLASVVTETGAQSKRNANVIQVLPDPGRDVSRAVLVDRSQPLDPGVYKACVTAFAPDGDVTGIFQVETFANNTRGTVLGEGVLSAKKGTDYSNAGCLNFVNYRSRIVDAVAFNHNAYTLKIGNIALTRLDNSPPPPPPAANSYTPPSWLQTDCTGDVSYLNAFGNWLSSLPDNAVVDLPQNACYLGQDQTIIQNKNGLTIHGNGATLKRTITPTTVGRQILIEGSNNIKIDGLKIVGPKNVCLGFAKERSSQHGIAIDWSTNVEISNVNIREANADFIYISGNSSGIRIHDNNMYQAGRQGFAMVGGSNVDYYNNVNIGAHRYSIDIEPNGDTPVSNVRLRSNQLIGPNIGFINGGSNNGPYGFNADDGTNNLNWTETLPGCNK